MKKVLEGFYQFKFDDTNATYVLHNPTIAVDEIYNGLQSTYSVDDMTYTISGGYFPFNSMKLFKKMGKRYKPFQKKADKV